MVASEGGSNEFDIFDIPKKPCLLLCSHIAMLVLLFTEQAFAASSLTLLKQFFHLRIASRQKQLPVTLKEDIAERPLF